MRRLRPRWWTAEVPALQENAHPGESAIREVPQRGRELRPRAVKGAQERTDERGAVWFGGEQSDGDETLGLQSEGEVFSRRVLTVMTSWSVSP
jgi:hypothetical protein